LKIVDSIRQATQDEHHMNSDLAIAADLLFAVLAIVLLTTKIFIIPRDA
jgi:hypothetical protein